MIDITNEEFLQAIFKEDTPFVYVTDFIHDPGDIPKDENLRSWSGNWFSRYRFSKGTNQYYTVGIFNPDTNGKARRRKALFIRVRVVVLDDVREKLTIDEVKKLPPPSYVMETSPGSEHWGYILIEPCYDRYLFDNLHDGLISKGLSPSGTDPGQKGVTRFVRLPEGFNTKKKKMVDGQPWQCRLTEWHPERTVTLEQLAEPFDIDLTAARASERVDGALDIPDHPILTSGLVNIKAKLSPGRYDITCPFVEDHTNAEDNGTAIFTNEDGTLGFKCHHGNCETLNVGDLIEELDSQQPGFAEELRNWQILRSFNEDTCRESGVDRSSEARTTPHEASSVNPMDQGMSAFFAAIPDSPEQIALAKKCLTAARLCEPVSRAVLYKQIRTHMGWTEAALNKVLKGMQEQKPRDMSDFYSGFIFSRELNRFYEPRTRTFYKTDAFRNSFCEFSPDVLNDALDYGGVKKVDKLEFAPERASIFSRGGVEYGNTWAQILETGSEGDCTPWLRHFNTLGWSEHMDHILKWMAFTMRHPGQKINHGVMFAGKEGVGKDWILEPLRRFMGDQYRSIQGNKLASEFNSYLLTVKYLNINETDVGDHKDARTISNLIKPLLAAPPDKLTVNPKGLPEFEVSNIVNVTMTTNSDHPLLMTEMSRRLFAVHTPLVVRDVGGEMLPEWKRYWRDCWAWMNNGGAGHCIDYLLNHVDLSEFDPGQAPAITGFVRNLVDQSKSLLQITIEDLIAKRAGAFAKDSLTSSEIVAGVKACALAGDSQVCVDLNKVNKITVGRVMSKTGAVCVRTKNDRAWQLR